MRHYLNGTEVTPRNADKIGWVLNYSDAPNLLSISVDSVTLVNEAMEICLNHLENGVGAAEGIPYQIVTETGQILDYFLDFTDDHTIKDFEITAKLKKRYSNDSFFKQADGLTFSSMSAQGAGFNVFDIPYLIIKNNQLEQGITLAISTYMVEQALEQAIKDTADLVGEFIEAISINPGPAIDAGIKLAAQIAYTAAMFIALLKLSQQLRELIFPKRRYFQGCTIRDLITRGCEFLGYTVSSTLLNEIQNETILPVPLIKEKENILDVLQNDLNFAFNYGYPTAMDTTPTLGSLIKAVELKNNARTIVRNKVVYIERRDHQYNTYQNNLEPALAIHGERTDAYQYNTNEIWKRSYVHYLIDTNDFHTMNEFDSTDAEDSTEAISINNPDLVMIHQFSDVPIPFALGSRKNKLNWIENRVFDLFTFIDILTDIFGNGTNLAALVLDRIGDLQVGDQFFTQTKLLYTIGGKQPPNFKDYIGARAVYNAWHDINFIGNNAFKVREVVNCVIDSNDFVILQDSNYALINGVVCELLRVEFFDYNSKANITYKEPYNWAFNLKKVAIND